MSKIEYRQGDLLDIKSGFIAHGCNSFGIMGSGVAKQIRNMYPECYEKYFRITNLSRGKVGYCIPYFQDELCIVNMITQREYGGRPGTQYVDYTAVHTCFTEADIQIKMISDKKNQKPYLHIPKIGAGLGGGDWNEIEKIIEYATPDIKVICWSL